ncbi:MAG TPA: isochorismatase family cysteine hydrolase [Gaiellaceae bacterium]|nr:isochorismatase family cysteine hydrolase [Gaiellaceae bacterium]
MTGAGGSDGWRERAARLPSLAPQRLELRRETCALLVVDLQYMDAHRDHGLGQALRESHPDLWGYYYGRIEKTVLPTTRRLLDAFRSFGGRVLYLTLGPALADGSDMVPLRRPEVAPGLTAAFHHQGTFEHGILPEVAPAPGELVVNKTSRGAFASTALEHVLRNMGVETLVVAGVSTSSCVESTAREAADRGFGVVIVEDATAEFDEESHEASLCQFAVRWGRVWTCDETLRALADTPSTAGR